MKNLKLFILIVAITGISCRKDKERPDDLPVIDPFYKTWSFYWYENRVQTMVASDELTGDHYGFIFKPDGTFIERKNTGECGINGCYFYDFYQGTWKKTGQDLYLINVPYFAGNLEYTMHILKLTSDTLKYTVLFPDLANFPWSRAEKRPPLH